MLPDIQNIQGVHPGSVLRRELAKRGWQSKQFALSLGEYPQTINAVCNERRGINPALSIKLGKALDADEAYFMLLQAFYEVKKQQDEMRKLMQSPDLSVFRQSLFWDTSIEKIDWIKQKRAVIQRVFERGNREEITEIIRFYGREVILGELEKIPHFLSSFNENVEKYLGVIL